MGGGGEGGRWEGGMEEEARPWDFPIPERPQSLFFLFLFFPPFKLFPFSPSASTTTSMGAKNIGGGGGKPPSHARAVQVVPKHAKIGRMKYLEKDSF